MQLPQFSNPAILRQAFIHRSFLNEHKIEKESNERLEFLGDSILSFIVSNWLYKELPDNPEGILTNLRSNLVNTKSLAAVSLELGLGKMLLLSKGEEDGGGRTNTSLLADTFEAVVGAIFLDQGLPAVQKFLEETLLPTSKISTDNIKDPKSHLQEIIQAQKFNSPVYKVISESGPDHHKIFTIEVEINGQPVARGTGKNKREAETAAASLALDKIAH